MRLEERTWIFTWRDVSLAKVDPLRLDTLMNALYEFNGLMIKCTKILLL